MCQWAMASLGGRMKCRQNLDQICYSTKYELARWRTFEQLNRGFVLVCETVNAMVCLKMGEGGDSPPIPADLGWPIF